MLQNIRDNIQGTIAKVIIAIICIPFVLFGVESLVSGGGNNEVADVNGVEISEQQLLEAVALRKRQLISQMGENIDPAMLEDARVRAEALDSLIERELLLQEAHSMGLIISKQQLDQAIIQNPDFQENGEFSNDLFRERLIQAGFNTEIFTRLFRNDLLVNQLASGVASTGFITDEEMALTARFSYETRDIRYISLDINKIKSEIKPSDEELKAYYESHQADYKTDEFVSVDYIELNQANFKPEVSDEDLKAAYDNEMAARDSKDQREISHLLVEVNADRSEADAKAILADVKSKLAGGASFADLVAEYSEDLGTKSSAGYLGVFDEAVFPPAFADALTGLEEGQVSDVVETDSGLHLVRLDKLVKDVPPTFEERKADLAEQIAAEQAQPAYLEAVEQLKNISFNAADLQEPSEALGVDIQSVASVKRNGSEDGLFSNPQVVSALYSEEVLADGQNSEVIELDAERAVVVRVKEHKLPEVLPFEQVEGRVANAFKTMKAKETLTENAEALKKALVDGADVEELAKEKGEQWQLLLAAKRNQPQDREIVAAAFKLPAAGDNQRALDVVSLASGDVAVIAVNNVKPGKLADINPQEKEFIQTYLSRAVSAETFAEFQQAIKDKADIREL